VDEDLGERVFFAGERRVGLLERRGFFLESLDGYLFPG
jgi:hypothetical protein